MKCCSLRHDLNSSPVKTWICRKLQNRTEKPPRTLHPVSSSACILDSDSTVSEPGHWHWYDDVWASFCVINQVCIFVWPPPQSRYRSILSPKRCPFCYSVVVTPILLSSTTLNTDNHRYVFHLHNFVISIVLSTWDDTICDLVRRIFFTHHNPSKCLCVKRSFLCCCWPIFHSVPVPWFNHWWAAAYFCF